MNQRLLGPLTLSFSNHIQWTFHGLFHRPKDFLSDKLFFAFNII